MEDGQYIELVKRALHGMECSFGLKSQKPRYGAAVLTINGGIYTGGVYKSPTHSLTVHAEQAALIHAACHGDPHIVAIAIVSEEDPSGLAFTNPCGLCKQLLYESSLYSGTSIRVILANPRGSYEVHSLESMIVLPWPTSP